MSNTRCNIYELLHPFSAISCITWPLFLNTSHIFWCAANSPVNSCNFLRVQSQILDTSCVHFIFDLTLFRLQFGTSLCSQQTDNEAVVAIQIIGLLCYTRGGNQRHADDWGVAGRGWKLSIGGQVLLPWVHTNRAQANVCCALRLPHILHN